MQKWTKEHASLVGNIIFADFLKKPLDKYRCIIEEVERSSLFGRLPIAIRRLSKAEASNRKDAYPSRVIAEIVRSGQSFSIRYVYEGFNKVYLVDTSKTERLVTEGSFARSEIGEVNSYLHKLRRISSRNELTHRVIKGIVTHQVRYLTTGNPVDLVPLSQVRLVDWINRKQKNLTPACPVGPPALYGDISNTWISRLVNPVRSKGSNGVNGISLIVPSGEEKPLRWFFQTQKEVNKRLIKQILDKENEDLQSGRLRKPYTDNELRLMLEDRLRSAVTVKKPVSSKGYGYVTEQRNRNEHRNPNRLPSISKRTVGHCRKDMGIPSAKRRLSGYKYPPLSANFSVPYPLTLEEVLRNAPPGPGIYEFRLKAKEVEYPNGKTQVIYIGSTRNINKRLRDHLGKNTKNGRIRDFLKNHECSFRYIQFSAPQPRTFTKVRGGGWRQKEKELYKLFVATYGSAPKCNMVRP